MNFTHIPDNAEKLADMEDKSNDPYITLNFKGDKLRPHDICESDFKKLVESGMMWEFYPDAPEIFTQGHNEL